MYIAIYFFKYFASLKYCLPIYTEGFQLLVSFFKVQSYYVQPFLTYIYTQSGAKRFAFVPLLLLMLPLAFTIHVLLLLPRLAERKRTKQYIAYILILKFFISFVVSFSPFCNHISNFQYHFSPMFQSFIF